ncbi:MAG: PucR family transcriptional regulator [Syntrophothermus sp.]
MVRKSGVTVQDLLQLDCMKPVQVVAGHRGLGRVVTNVNVMEVPDIANWVSAGDFLLTTAYPIRDDVDAQAHLVPQLAAKGLAGLAVKPKRYLESIPPKMIEQADKLDFPLLELPVETSFSEIINPILSEILQIQTSYFRKSEEAHRLFMEVVLKGGKIADIANTLAKLVDNSVVILDEAEAILAKSLVSWDEESLEHYNRKRGDLPAEVMDPLESGVKYTKMSFSASAEPPAPPWPPGPMPPRQMPPVLHEFRTPIVASGQTRGFLSIWDNHRPLTQNDFIFIDQAMTVAALEILTERSVMEIERRYRNEFLDDLLKDSRLDDRELIARARYLGWDLNRNYAALVFNITDLRGCTAKARQDEPTIQEAKERLFCHIVGAMGPQERFIAGTKSDSIILLLAPPKEIEEKKAQDYFTRRAEEILRATESKVRDFTVSLGVGRFYPGIAGLRKSYTEALKALAIGKSLPGGGCVIHFGQLGVYRLLQQIVDWNELEGFYCETILPLDIHDRNSNSDLVKTLNAYFECNGNLKRVSEKLFTHYNTILYRMERIEALTGLDLKFHEHRLNLLIGLKIRRILGEKGLIGETACGK